MNEKPPVDSWKVPLPVITNLNITFQSREKAKVFPFAHINELMGKFVAFPPFQLQSKLHSNMSENFNELRKTMKKFFDGDKWKREKLSRLHLEKKSFEIKLKSLKWIFLKFSIFSRKLIFEVRQKDSCERFDDVFVTSGVFQVINGHRNVAVDADKCSTISIRVSLKCENWRFRAADFWLILDENLSLCLEEGVISAYIFHLWTELL